MKTYRDTIRKEMGRVFEHIFFLIISLMAIACSGNSLETDAPEKDPQQNMPDKIELANGVTDNYVFPSEGGAVAITFAASTNWSASVINDRADSWCTISPGNGSASAGASISITAKENTATEDRSASIVIKAGTANTTIKVSQKQKDAITVTRSSFEMEADGGDIEIEVKANVDFQYAIQDSSKEWIEYTSTKAMKSTTLIFSVKRNDNVENREGEITISNGTITEKIKVFQKGETPSIVLNKKEYTAKAEGETFAVDVTSNLNIQAKIEHSNGLYWLEENKSKSMSTNTFYFTATKNESYSNREARIIFTNDSNTLSDTVSVTQLQRDAIITGKEQYRFGQEGGNMDIEIQTNVDVNVTISEDAAGWISQINTKGLKTRTLHFNIASCGFCETREGTITLEGGNASQTIKVMQSDTTSELAKERAILMDLYNSTWSWNKKENWGSTRPVGEWYGITTDSDGYVINIDLGANSINGSIPESISNLKRLKQLHLHNNQLIGYIPESIGKLRNLYKLDLSSNRLSGSVPQSMENLVALKYLYIQNNRLTGIIPSGIFTLPKLVEFLYDKDKLSKENSVTINIPPDNEIWYTSTTGKIIELDYYPYELVSNTYKNGIGKFVFAEDVTDIGAYFGSNGSNDDEDLAKFASITLPSKIKKIERYYALGNLHNASSLIMPENLETIGTDFIGGFGKYLNEKHIYFLSKKCPEKGWLSWRIFWNQSSTLYVHYPKGSDYSAVETMLEEWQNEISNFKYVLVETEYNIIHN